MPSNMRELTKEALQQGFDHVVEGLFTEYFKLCALAENNETKQKQADERLKMGLGIAKQCFADSIRLADD